MNKIPTILDLSPDDYKYVVEDGEEGFSPDRNRFIIQETIRISEENSKRNKKEYMDRLGERVHAVASYWRHIYEGKTTSLEKYLGRNYLAYLRGDDIRKVMAAKISDNAWKNAQPIRRLKNA